MAERTRESLLQALLIERASRQWTVRAEKAAEAELVERGHTIIRGENDGQGEMDYHEDHLWDWYEENHPEDPDPHDPGDDHGWKFVDSEMRDEELDALIRILTSDRP